MTTRLTTIRFEAATLDRVRHLAKSQRVGYQTLIKRLVDQGLERLEASMRLDPVVDQIKAEIGTPEVTPDTRRVFQQALTALHSLQGFIDDVGRRAATANPPAGDLMQSRLELARETIMAIQEELAFQDGLVKEAVGKRSVLENPGINEVFENM